MSGRGAGSALGRLRPDLTGAKIRPLERAHHGTLPRAGESFPAEHLAVPGEPYPARGG